MERKGVVCGAGGAEDKGLVLEARGVVGRDIDKSVLDERCDFKIHWDEAIVVDVRDPQKHEVTRSRFGRFNLGPLASNPGTTSCSYCILRPQKNNRIMLLPVTRSPNR